MKTYICPDCGQKIDNNLHDCPNCGCPATMLKEVVQQETATFDSNEKVYYSNSRVRITNKIWSFGGWNVNVNGESLVMHFPVTSISSVTMSRKIAWWMFLLALLFLVASIFCFVIGSDAYYGGYLVVLGIPCIFISCLLIYFGIQMNNKRQIVIRPHNSLNSFHLKVDTPEEAQKYIQPMLQSLIENR